MSSEEKPIIRKVSQSTLPYQLGNNLLASVSFETSYIINRYIDKINNTEPWLPYHGELIAIDDIYLYVNVAIELDTVLFDLLQHLRGQHMTTSEILDFITGYFSLDVLKSYLSEVMLMSTDESPSIDLQENIPTQDNNDSNTGKPTLVLADINLVDYSIASEGSSE